MGELPVPTHMRNHLYLVHQPIESELAGQTEVPSKDQEGQEPPEKGN